MRDFYSARAFDSDDDSDDSDKSSRSDEGRFDKSAHDMDAKSSLNKGQRLLYESQLKKAKATRQSKLSSTINSGFPGRGGPKQIDKQSIDQSSRQSKDFIIRVKGTPTNQSRSKLGDDGAGYNHLKKNERKLLNQNQAGNLKGQNEVI